MNEQEFTTMALSFDGTVDLSHFDRVAFKVIKKRIYATLHQLTNSVNLKLSLDDQGTFCALPSGNVFPVDNKWGEQGWTTVQLSHIDKDLMFEMLNSAYLDVFKKQPKANKP